MTLGLYVLLLSFIVGAIVRIPLALVMFLGGILYLWSTSQDVGLLIGQVMNSMSTMYVLVAIPMFILAANIMNAATVSERLWNAAEALVGRFSGGTGHVTVLMSFIFSSMSGSAVTDAAGPGLVATRMMREVGRYPAGLACAITAASATIAPIIPPSIPMVIYALLSGASIGALFIAGIVPGILMAISLMITISLLARKYGLPPGNAVPLKGIPMVLLKAALPMTLPVVLLGGIWSGIFSPTEAAAVAAGWALVLGTVVYRRITVPMVGKILFESSKQSASTLLLIAGAYILNYAIANERLSEHIVAYVASMGLTPMQFMLLINLLFLALGCFLDGAVILLVFVPLLIPTVKALGIDLTYFGVVIIVNFMIGLITPPYGLLLFVMSSLTRVPLIEIARASLPFIGVLLLLLLLLTLFPSIILFLPHFFGYPTA